MTVGIGELLRRPPNTAGRTATPGIWRTTDISPQARSAAAADSHPLASAWPASWEMANLNAPP